MEVFKVEFEVRDNEVDMQGIVNNGNYFIYFQHARHKFLQHIGISFAEMTKQKQLYVLVSCQIHFKHSLKPEDKFYVTCRLVPDGRIKFIVEQEIKRLPDETLIASSRNSIVCLDGHKNNQPYLPEIIQKALAASL